MNDRRFLRMLRQYTQLANHLHKSYADQVNGLIAQHDKSLRGQDVPVEYQINRMAWTRAAATAEYGKVDREFKAKPIEEEDSPR